MLKDLAKDPIPYLPADKLWTAEVALASYTTKENVNRSIAEQLGGDHCHAVNHLMRLPGTINWPTAAKKRRGRVPVMSAIERADCGLVYAADRLARYFPPVAPLADRAEVDIGEVEPLDFADLDLPKSHPLYATLMFPEDDGSKAMLLAAGDLYRAGFDEEVIAGILMNEDIPASAHAHRQSNPRRAVLRAISRIVGDAENSARSGGEAGAGSRSADSGASPTGAASVADALRSALLEPADWEGQPIPPREYAIEGLIPLHIVAAMTGDGAVGKSLLMQGAATSMALGAQFLGRRCHRTNAAYITAEDAGRELWERQDAICRSLDVRLSDLRGRLVLASLVAMAEKALTHLGRDDRLRPTALYEAMRDLIVERGLGFLVLDNAGHFYGGNEIIRDQVVYFLGLLNKLAVETGCTIILISHPNKSGASYSGSTAWRNQVRLQLHLSKPDDAAADPHLRLLTLEKANYAPAGDPIRVIWHHGAMVLESAVPESDRSFDAVKQQQDNLFLTCLDSLLEQQVNVSASKQAGNYAPRIFAQRREVRGLNAKQLEECMDRLFARKLIEVGELPFRSSDRKRIDGVRRAARTVVDDDPM